MRGRCIAPIRITLQTLRKVMKRHNGRSKTRRPTHFQQCQLASRKGIAGLALIVRQKQELLAGREREYRRLDQAAGKADAKAAEAARAAIADVDAGLEKVDALLSRDFPDYSAMARPQPLSISETQVLLGKRQALILFLDMPQFGRLPEKTIVFALTKADVRWVSLPLGTRALWQRVTALRCGLDSSNWRFGEASRERCKGLLGTEVVEGVLPPFDAISAYALYRDLFGEIEDLIKDKSLLIVPSGALTQLPFEVLVVAKPDDNLSRFEAYKAAAWLGQRSPLTVLPSVASLKALRNAKASGASQPFIGFGNPLLTGIKGDDRRAWGKQNCFKLAAPKRNLIASFSSTLASLFRGGQPNVEDLRHQPPLPETANELCAVAHALGVPDTAFDKAVFLGGRANRHRGQGTVEKRRAGASEGNSFRHPRACRRRNGHLC